MAFRVAVEAAVRLSNSGTWSRLGDDRRLRTAWFGGPCRPEAAAFPEGIDLRPSENWVRRVLRVVTRQSGFQQFHARIFRAGANPRNQPPIAIDVSPFEICVLFKKHDAREPPGDVTERLSSFGGVYPFEPNTNCALFA